MPGRHAGFWVIQVPGWLLLIYLVYAQAIPAFDYELGVRMGTQESAREITRVGAAFWYGFAFADLLVYIPLLAAGLLGHGMGARWGSLVMGSALGITLYWPLVCLAAIAKAQGAPGWNPADTTQYWVVLPIIALWAAVGLWQLARAE